jgi:glycerophosphoryl diester phosphodiesterase
VSPNCRKKSDSDPVVLAHRGWSDRYPENTAIAFSRALTLPIDGIELDVQMTRDHVPVVYHDRTLHKIGAGRRRVSSLDWSALTELDAGSWKSPQYSGERILQLNDALARYASLTRLHVEIKLREKDPDRLTILAQQVTDLLINIPRQHRPRLLCFSEDVLLRSHDHHPDIDRFWNLRRPVSLRSLRANRHLLSGICCSAGNLTERFVDQVHGEELPVFAFTCNTSRTLNRILALGVDGVFSDRPDWLIEQLERRSR